MHIRAATVEDHGFLLEMLLEAFNWSGDRRWEEHDLSANEHLRRYLAGWGRATDFGQVAEGDNGTPVGAAWARILSADQPGYGFVSDEIPELTIAVTRSHRGRGVGRQLLGALTQEARSRGHRALSLSVEDGNAARRLYLSCGFRAVGRVGNADTMLLELSRGA